MSKKYELTNETITVNGVTLYRIRALRGFGNGIVHAGEFGGFVEHERNLSHGGFSWVYDDACIFENARISGNGFINESVIVSGNARIFENAHIYSKAVVDGDARVSGTAGVYSDVRITDNVNVSGPSVVTGNLSLTGETEWCIEYTDNPNHVFFTSSVVIKDATIKTRSDFIREFPEWCI